MMKRLPRSWTFRNIGKGFFDPGLELVKLMLRLDGQGHGARAVVPVLERHEHLVHFVILELRMRILFQRLSEVVQRNDSKMKSPVLIRWLYY